MTEGLAIVLLVIAIVVQGVAIMAIVFLVTPTSSDIPIPGPMQTRPFGEVSKKKLK